MSDSKSYEWQQKLLSVFRDKAPLSGEESDGLLAQWTEKIVVRRGEFLVSRGQVERRLFYVLSGTMRIYFPHGDEEICVGFAHPHNLICSYPSFIRQKPSDYYIEALTKTETRAIDRSQFYGLLDKHRNLERAWRMLEEEALLGKIERETEMLTFTPEERYKRLLARSPHIFQLIPKKYIASYLRMSPETLSRMKPQ